MDNSPLNLAHYEHRKAESYLLLCNFDKAIESHEIAIVCLHNALLMTTSLKAIDSINLQCDYHKKQIQLIQFKKERFGNSKKNSEKQKHKMAKQGAFDLCKEATSDNLQVAFNKKMDEADSIVEMLYKRNIKNDNDSLGDNDSIDKHVVQCHNINDNLIVSGVKEPKNLDTVIEELQVVNLQLRKFVNQLLNQLEAVQLELKVLKSREAFVEDDLEKRIGDQNNTVSRPQPVYNTPLEVITDSVEENSSPFVFSPCTEISLGALSDDRELPPLPPLEMPEFDFESLISQIKIKTEDKPINQNNGY